jgi:low temperature requirement protein LtrA
MLALRGTPRLHDDPRRGDPGDRHASWLELLLDLIVAVTVIELAQALVADLTWTSLGRTLLYLIPVWWLWEGFTWYADRYDTDDLLYRLLFAVGIGGFAAMPLTLDNTTHFVLAYLVAEAALTALYVHAAHRYPATAGFAWTCVALFLVGMSCWALSLAFPEPVRYGLWAAGLGVEVFAPLVAGGVVAAMPVRARHIPERLGLLTLVSLGGMALVTLDRLQVADASGALEKVLAFAVLLLLWHLYFDHVDGSAIHGGHWPRAIYNYAHLFVLAGVVVAGAGVAHALTSPAGAPLPFPARLALAGGVTVYAASLAITAAVSPATNRARVRDSRAGAALALATLAVVPLSPAQALIAVVVVLTVSAAATTGRPSASRTA